MRALGHIRSLYTGGRLARTFGQISGATVVAADEIASCTSDSTSARAYRSAKRRNWAHVRTTVDAVAAGASSGAQRPKRKVRRQLVP